MSQTNSQQEMIYRSLTGRIQLGFYQDGERFPSVHEIAERYQVSPCPVQIALKALERDGIIKLNRGSYTVVMRKPCEDYLGSSAFQVRIEALADLSQTLKLISSSISALALNYVEFYDDSILLGENCSHVYLGKTLYKLFDESIRALGSQIIKSLYYDVGTFIGSAFQDILHKVLGEEKDRDLLRGLAEEFLQSRTEIQNGHCQAGKIRLENMEKLYFDVVEQSLIEMQKNIPNLDQEVFIWEPYKGRAKYCDIIAIDLVCKINGGIYPVDSLLPRNSVLADTYHVSGMTIRRTVDLLNKLDLVRTINGLGTRVISTGDASIPHRLKELKIDSNFKRFLEALQLLAAISKAVIEYSFPYCPEEYLESIYSALAIPREKSAMVATISTCLQAIVRGCPLRTVREIYEKITLLLLNGSVLRLAETGDEEMPEWNGLSNSLRESLVQGEFGRFAEAFQQLIVKAFADTKQKLLEIGIEDVEKIVNPVF